MPDYSLTKEAVSDLNGIWSYTEEQWSETQADKYYELILEKCIQIAINPLLGRPYSKLSNGLRGVKINRHIIFFRSVSFEEIEVARILHEQMDIKARLRDSSPT